MRQWPGAGMFKHIGHKIITVVGIIVTLDLIGLGVFYTKHQESTILAQNQRTMGKLTESISQALQTVMLAGYANIAQEFADRLKAVPDVEDFRVLRVDGLEAFRDNHTIDEVNARSGREEFQPRLEAKRIAVLGTEHAELRRAVATREVTSYYEIASTGERTLTFLAPILNGEACHKCHGSDAPVRGVLKLTTSLAPAEHDIRQTWIQSTVVVGTAISITILVTGLMIRRSVVGPIDSVTRAMIRASGGDLSHEVPILGSDELSQMAGSFNEMTKQLLKTYTGLQNEQDKLSTIILCSREGIVVTDSDGRVVLVNPAAEHLLGKSATRIIEDGFFSLLDDSERMLQWLEQTNTTQEPELVKYKERILSVYAATIRSKAGHVIGSAALIRDVTEEKRLEQQLIRLSTTDGLTGLYNRRYLDETLAAELTRAKRYRTPLALFLLDVDHFKKFNDEHGHDQGDRVLQALARQMRNSVRQVDHPCRYGGEEFVLILPNTSLDGAVVVAEQLRRAVEAMEVDGLRVTISIGVAAIPPMRCELSDTFLEAADKALYQAKKNGRNQVCVVGHDAFGHSVEPLC